MPELNSIQVLGMQDSVEEQLNYGYKDRLFNGIRPHGRQGNFPLLFRVRSIYELKKEGYRPALVDDVDFKSKWYRGLSYYRLNPKLNRVLRLACAAVKKNSKSSSKEYISLNYNEQLYGVDYASNKYLDTNTVTYPVGSNSHVSLYEVNTLVYGETYMLDFMYSLDYIMYLTDFKQYYKYKQKKKGNKGISHE